MNLAFLAGHKYIRRSTLHRGVGFTNVRTVAVVVIMERFNPQVELPIFHHQPTQSVSDWLLHKGCALFLDKEVAST